jgi:alpha-L-fucosidase 2
MKTALRILITASCALVLGICPVFAAGNSFVASNDVKWAALGQNENDSMPIGNGDLAANVWTEQNGDLVLLVSKSDAWTEMGKLVKLGRVRIHLAPNPFVNAADFTQTLRLEDGSIEVKSGDNTLLVWADANHPVIHVEANLSQPATLQANLEIWRTKTHPYQGHSPDKGGLFEFGSHNVPVDFEADTVLPPAGNHLSWYHFNAASIYPLVLDQEHMREIAAKYPDPLLHRCFGASLLGTGLVSKDDHTLASAAPGRKLRLDLVALTTSQAASPQAWKSSLDRLTSQVDAVPINTARAASSRWWQQFWDRSWVQVSGTADAEKVSQGYVMQRYMMAASSRGAFPPKFNGGLFTVGHDMPADRDSTEEDHNPDFRLWGNSYWNQNNRLLYWPLVATGDLDLLQLWFDMYLHALPLTEERTRQYFHHDGAAFIDTVYFWGLPNLNDFGWDNPTTEVQSHWMRYHTQGTLEVIAEMLDEYDVTQDAAFARKDIVPFATAILAYYDQHWQRGTDDKILFSPTQSIETYQLDAANPTPDIAGLKHVLPRLLALPAALTTPQQRQAWTKLLADLPPIAMGKTHDGKLPLDLQTQDPDGTTIILPAEKYGPTRNVENPQLYVAFPYRLYGVGKPDLKLARDTFASRLFPQDTCWGQDGTQAAVLGLTETAKKAAIDEFTDFGDQRFQWFWKAGHDWIPDLDNGGAGMITLQLMLMQTDGKRIQLLPAWPADWTADFMLHAPYHTTVEGHVENGKITNLKVVPQQRAKDVVVVTPESTQ